MTAATDRATCVACGSTGPSHLALDGLIRRCGACSFAWTATEVETPEELYGTGYHDGEGYDDYYDPTARRFESRRRLDWLLATGPARTLLEIGAAAGFFVEAARGAGIEAEGIELSAGAAAYATERLGVPVATAAFEDVAVDRQFDVVAAFHVLEHLGDPTAFLRRARGMVVPGGRLALEVPNIDAATVRRLGSAWPHIQPRYHLWHFSPATLGRMVTDAGFEVVASDTVFSRFYGRPVGRFRHARELLVADVAASRSLRVAHPSLGDVCRLVARAPGSP